MRTRVASWTGLCLATLLTLLLACAGTPEPRSAGTLAEGGSLERPERVVRGKGGYTLALPPGWSRQTPDPDQVGVDLSFEREGASAWLLTLPVSGKTLRLDAMASSRRAALLAAGAARYREERYLPGGATDRVASLARYAAGGEVILVLTVVRPPFGVEVVAGTHRAEVELELEQILESVALDVEGER